MNSKTNDIAKLMTFILKRMTFVLSPSRRSLFQDSKLAHFCRRAKKKKKNLILLACFFFLSPIGIPSCTPTWFALFSNPEKKSDWTINLDRGIFSP